MVTCARFFSTVQLGYFIMFDKLLKLNQAIGAASICAAAIPVLIDLERLASNGAPKAASNALSRVDGAVYESLNGKSPTRAYERKYYNVRSAIKAKLISQ